MAVIYLEFVTCAGSIPQDIESVNKLQLVEIYIRGKQANAFCVGTKISNL